MRDVLVVVDMQNDFIDGALGTAEAVAIVPKAAEKIRSFDGAVFFTLDTHGENYLETQEGRRLPVPHCIHGTRGWQLRDELQGLNSNATVMDIDKSSFGSHTLAAKLRVMDFEEGISSITLIGVCTDICVISNALILKAALPEVPITVDAACCAGVTPETHDNALKAMKMCHIDIVNAE